MGGFTSATGGVVAACTGWLTLLSHPCTGKSRNQKGPRSLSEEVTDQQENGHDDSERRDTAVSKGNTIAKVSHRNFSVLLTQTVRCLSWF